MPWRELIFTADGFVLPKLFHQSKKVQDLDLPDALERLGLSDAASVATTPSHSRRGSEAQATTITTSAPHSKSALQRVKGMGAKVSSYTDVTNGAMAFSLRHDAAAESLAALSSLPPSAERVALPVAA
jgi:hypothetical protein